MTNESYFFRDKLPFALFRDTIIPELLASRAKQRRTYSGLSAESTTGRSLNRCHSSSRTTRNMAPRVFGARPRAWSMYSSNRRNSSSTGVAITDRGATTPSVRNTTIR